MEEKGRKETLTTLIESGQLAPQYIEQARHLADIKPKPVQWYRFFQSLLFVCGILGISCGLIFFIAANWPNMSNIGKFALAQSFVLISVAGYCWFANTRAIAKYCLLAAVLGLGALIALFGQTYQTGADPWQLFFNWALISTPWIMLSCFPALWIMWLILLNLAGALYFDLYAVAYEHVLQIALVANACALMVWIAASKRFKWLSGMWSTNLLATYCVYLASMNAVIGIFDNAFLNLAIWIVFIAILVFFFYAKTRNLFVLALASCSLIIVANSAIFKMFDNSDYLAAFLFTFIATIGLGASATVWIKQLWLAQSANGLKTHVGINADINRGTK